MARKNGVPRIHASFIMLLLSTILLMVTAAKGQDGGLDNCTVSEGTAYTAKEPAVFSDASETFFSLPSMESFTMPELSNLTVCAWARPKPTTLSRCTYLNYYTEDEQGTLNNRIGLFSTYSTLSNSNRRTAGMYINGYAVLDEDSGSTLWSFYDQDWHSICGTWSSHTGEGKVYIDGKIIALTPNLTQVGDLIEGNGTVKICPVATRGAVAHQSSNCNGSVGSIDLWPYSVRLGCIVNAIDCSASGDLLHIDWTATGFTGDSAGISAGVNADVSAGMISWDSSDKAWQCSVASYTGSAPTETAVTLSTTIHGRPDQDTEPAVITYTDEEKGVTLSTTIQGKQGQETEPNIRTDRDQGALIPSAYIYGAAGGGALLVLIPGTIAVVLLVRRNKKRRPSQGNIRDKEFNNSEYQRDQTDPDFHLDSLVIGTDPLRKVKARGTESINGYTECSPKLTSTAGRTHQTTTGTSNKVHRPNMKGMYGGPEFEVSNAPSHIYSVITRSKSTSKHDIDDDNYNGDGDHEENEARFVDNELYGSHN